MTPDAVIIRFPDGSKEFRFSEIVEGDVIWHDGARYSVLSVSVDGGGRPVAVVEPEATSLADVLQSEEGAIRLTALEA
jgi:hypothetical protein